MCLELAGPATSDLHRPLEPTAVTEGKVEAGTSSIGEKSSRTTAEANVRSPAVPAKCGRIHFARLSMVQA